MKISGAILVVWAASALVCAGCNDPLAHRMATERRQQARTHLEMYSAREARSPRQSAATIDLARRTEQRHAEKDAANRRYLREWPKRERARWRESEPAYSRHIADLLRGHPEKIPWSIRSMFY